MGKISVIYGAALSKVNVNANGHPVGLLVRCKNLSGELVAPLKPERE